MTRQEQQGDLAIWQDGNELLFMFVCGIDESVGQLKVITFRSSGRRYVERIYRNFYDWTDYCECN